MVSQGACFLEMHAWHQNLNKAPQILIFSALKLTSCELVVFVDMNAYILTEVRIFKAILKEIHAIALGSCCMLTKKR